MCGHASHNHTDETNSDSTETLVEREPSSIDYGEDDSPVIASGESDIDETEDEEGYEDEEDEEEDYEDDPVSEEAPQETEAEYLASHPGVAAVANLFTYLDTTPEERIAGIQPTVADTYLRAYGFHTARLEEKREQIRDMIVTNVTNPLFFSEGAPAMSLIREPGGQDLFSNPDSTDAFVALAVALGYAKVEIPDGFPGELALLLGLDKLTFNLIGKTLFGTVNEAAA